MTDRYNPLLYADAYKLSHPEQYPTDLTKLSAYLEARSEGASTVFFGLQFFIKEYLSTPITMDMIDEAEEFWTDYGEPFNRAGFERIVTEHGGYFPVEIHAVEEGSIVQTQNVLVQVTNTDPELPWVTTFIETMLLGNMWYPITVASLSAGVKSAMKTMLIATGCENPDAVVKYGLNDFGFRGVSSKQSAGIGGMAHLVSFDGSDTAEALIYARRYYDANIKYLSIPATEHSTIITHGKDGEKKAYEQYLDTFLKEGSLIACVSDSYDLWKTIELWGTEFKDKIVNSGGTLVVRLDSGEMVPTTLRALEMLEKNFGSTLTSTGHKLLPPCVRVLYSDGIGVQDILEMLFELAENGWAVENVNYGMGGGLLQEVTRDTFSFAYKPSEEIKGGETLDVYKDPITSKGTKTSKRGKLALIKEDNTFKTIRDEELDGRENYLKLVWNTGTLLKEVTFDEVRETANKYINGTINEE